MMFFFGVYMVPTLAFHELNFIVNNTNQKPSIIKTKM